MDEVEAALRMSCRTCSGRALRSSSAAPRREPSRPARGAYYAHPQNRFWSALHAIGLTPRLLMPEEYPELPQWGLGLTDIAKHVSGMDRELPPGALGREACAALEAKIKAAAPAWLAFTSLAAGRRYLGRAAGFGEQRERIGRTRLWLLPSPSPTAGWNWATNKHWWRALADQAGSAPPEDPV